MKNLSSISITAFFLIVTISFKNAIAQNTSPYWSLAGNNNATSSSKLGTTNSNPVRLVTNNLERVRIDPSGNVGIGITTPVNILTVKASGGTPKSSWSSGLTPSPFYGFAESMSTQFNLATASGSSSNRPIFNTRRARGTLSSPSAVQSGDILASFIASGYDGSNFQNPASIDFYVDGTPSSGHVPARISFYTGTSGSRTERLRIGNSGNITFNTNQLFIQQSTGFIGMGTVTPSAKLTVITSSGSSYGADIENTGSGTALYAIGEPGEERGGIGVVGVGYDEGVEGLASEGDGIYGQSDDGYAGYFDGDVYSTENFTTSDENLKKNVQDFSSAMNIINELKPKYYEFKDDVKYTFLHLPKGNHYGLLAQDLEEVLPGLVKEYKHQIIAFKSRIKNPLIQQGTQNETKQSVDIKAVNYTELIPIIVKSLQEQEAVIEAKDQKITDLQSRLDNLQKILMEKGLINSSEINNISSPVPLSKASLSQSIPNPAAGITSLPYFIPNDVKKAAIFITSIDGALLRSYPITKTGNGQLAINTKELVAGTYIYTLTINGIKSDSKKMVVAR